MHGVSVLPVRTSLAQRPESISVADICQPCRMGHWSYSEIFLLPLTLAVVCHGCLSAARPQRLWAFYAVSIEPARYACWWRLGDRWNGGLAVSSHPTTAFSPSRAARASRICGKAGYRPLTAALRRAWPVPGNSARATGARSCRSFLSPLTLL